MRPFAWWTTLALLLLSGCRVHTLEDGQYTLTPTQTLRDDCGLAGTDLFGPVTLRTEGHVVSLALSKPSLSLVGTYRYSVEEMTLDGTLSNYSTTLRGRECLLDQVTIHVDTVTSGPNAFTGSASVNFDARTPDECVCKYWFQFSAQRN